MNQARAHTRTHKIIICASKPSPIHDTIPDTRHMNPQKQFSPTNKTELQTALNACLHSSGLTFKADFNVSNLLELAVSEIAAHDQKSRILYQLITQAPTRTNGGVNVLQLVAKTIQASAVAKLPPAVSMMPGKH